MGYIKKDSVAYVSAKLTDYGRERLALGRLNFSYWGFGDSEIDYGTFNNTYTWLNNGNGGNVDLGLLDILRPADAPPGQRYPLLRVPGNSGSSYTSINSPEVLKTVVNNQAVTRGFFTGETQDATNYPERKYDYSLRTATTYTKAVGSVNLGSIRRTGNYTLNDDGTWGGGGKFGVVTDVSGNGVEPVAGDFMLLLPNEFQGPTTGVIPGPGPGHVDSAYPTPYLWYRIVEVEAGTLAANTLLLTVDRQIPNFTGSTTTQYRESSVFFYDGGGVSHNPIDIYYGTGTTIPYWNELSLSFDSNCDVSINDVKIWNMNIPWTETVPGLTASTHGTLANFGSTAYTSTKEYLEYTKPVFSESYGGIVDDYRQKSIAVLHYTNNAISNFYGEGFYWADNGVNNFQVTLPEVMWNSTGNTTIGLLLTGETRTTPRTISSIYNSNSELKYYQLHTSGGTAGITEPSYTTPVSVGKIFPELKIAVIDDEEIVSSLSYKSNRNWALPQLIANYGATEPGTEGISQPGDQFWITYQFTTTSGFTNGMYCNKFTFMTQDTTNCDNCDGANKNLLLTFPYGSLPFMRRGGISSTLGTPGADDDATTKFIGWDATGFDILIQKTQNNEQPLSNGWTRVPITQSKDGTSIFNSHNGVNWVDYEILYNKEFEITKALFEADPGVPDGGKYSLNDWILMPTLTDITDSTPKHTLTFGDERWLWGNIDTDIKATVFRTTFMFTAAGTDFNTSQNPTWGTGDAEPSHNVRISEVSVYDSDFREVIVGKISDPIEKKQDSQFTLAMGLDF
mgnify:FL=1